MALARVPRPEHIGELLYKIHEEARGELLTYLVVSQLVARARSGEWLTPEHLGESENIWLKANGGNCDVAERLRLGQDSSKVAFEMLAIPMMKDLASLTAMFADSRRLDYRNPIVRGVFDVCANYLLGPLDVRRVGRPHA
ncbi:hypothetical protein P3T18_001112 [Paraburkholderia sp. GAS199]|uniref:hypothetical protein n=1 Tax=Paraburkholderia sp. GAS199 TaxID=3035126 RepID=UPI003D231875